MILKTIKESQDDYNKKYKAYQRYKIQKIYIKEAETLTAEVQKSEKKIEKLDNFIQEVSQIIKNKSSQQSDIKNKSYAKFY